MKIEIPLHTIVFSSAPSGCGKSTFFTEKMIPSLKSQYPDLNIQYISSDDVRRELLGNMDAHKYDPLMGYTSDLAFKLLNTKLEMLLSSTIRAEIIIVDTTGMSKYFYDDMKRLGTDFHYNLMPLLWNFSSVNDYYKYTTDNSITARHVKNISQNILPICTKKNFPHLVKFKKHPEDCEFEVINYDFYKSHRLSNDIEYTIISDIHGCYDELVSIIEENNCQVVDGKIIGEKMFIVQDYIDKGTQIREVVEFIYNNRDKVLPLIANHENFVYKYLKGLIERKSFEEGVLDKLIVDYFDSATLFQEDEELRNKFFELFESSKAFYTNDNFFVNHAPCHPKYLGKIDNKSLTKMRNYVYVKREDEDTIEDFNVKLEEDLSFIKNFTYRFDKPVIWGHVSLKHLMRHNNVYMIDTGCVSGNKLTSLSIDTYTNKVYVKSVPAVESKDVELPNIFVYTQVKRLDMSELEHTDFKRIRNLGLNKVNFISGTMCPADKVEETGSLEDLSTALEYYKQKGCKKVIIQKKYMGSSAQIYLFTDIEKCYSTSRNGFVIDKRVDLKDLYETLIAKYRDYMTANDFSMILLNGELMPWDLLGRSLINEQYQPIAVGLQTEFDVLKETGFFDKIQSLTGHKDRNQFTKDKNLLNKKALSEKYGHKDYEMLKNISKFENQLITEDKYYEYMGTYLRQMELFAQEGKIDFHAFGLLKSVRNDGTEKFYFEDSNEDIFTTVSDDSYVTIDFSDENYSEIAEAYYDIVTQNEELEGVVIKPEIMYTKGIAHAIKVRNKNYLTLIYGFDYLKESKYEKLLRRKRVGKKLKHSIEEFEIGKRMLEIPYSEISKDNNDYTNICIEMVIDEINVSKLDPRL